MADPKHDPRYPESQEYDLEFRGQLKVVTVTIIGAVIAAMILATFWQNGNDPRGNPLPPYKQSAPM